MPVELAFVNKKKLTEEIMKSHRSGCRPSDCRRLQLQQPAAGLPPRMFRRSLPPARSRVFRSSPWISSTPGQKPLGEQVMKVSSVGLAGPYNPMMRSPVLGQKLFDLFA